ncbi:MAG TPA: hypothetical protein VKW08_07060 [Xanthobacteraceae bacterium]|jgi:hypothetical protein|nr:hypothetical protein [Xanthobacteraceae bacterium]
MAKIKLVLMALLLLQIAPAANAASKRQHHATGAYSAYDYASGASSSSYNYAKKAFGWNAGLYPFNVTPDERPTPLRSDGECWVPTNLGNPQWGPCP